MLNYHVRNLLVLTKDLRLPRAGDFEGKIC